MTFLENFQLYKNCTLRKFFLTKIQNPNYTDTYKKKNNWILLD